jgi:hypothetical protein
MAETVCAVRPVVPAISTRLVGPSTRMVSSTTWRL